MTSKRRKLASAINIAWFHKLLADLEDDDFDCIVPERALEREVSIDQVRRSFAHGTESCLAAMSLQRKDWAPITSASSDTSTDIGSDLEADHVDSLGVGLPYWPGARRVRFADEVGESLEEVHEIPMRTKKKVLSSMLAMHVELSDFFLDSDEECTSGSDVVSALARLQL